MVVVLLQDQSPSGRLLFSVESDQSPSGRLLVCGDRKKFGPIFLAILSGLFFRALFYQDFGPTCNY